MVRLNSRKRLLFSLLSLLLVVIAGCDHSETTAQAPEPHPSSQPLVLHVGLPPELSLFAQKKRYEPLMNYLSRETGVTFKVQVLPHHGDLVDDFTKLDLDAAFFGGFTGALAIRKLGVVPLARPQFNGGRSTYYGLVFVRKDSGIRTAADMLGKRMVFVDRASAAGYLLPLDFFHKIGITNYSEWFKEYYFSGTHEDAILEVLNGYADIGAAKSSVFHRLAKENKRITQELEILATSPHLPTISLAVRKDLPDELKKVIEIQLLTMDQNPGGRAILKEFGAEKFVPTTVKDYQPVFDYAAGIGLDLATYPYLND